MRYVPQELEKLFKTVDVVVGPDGKILHHSNVEVPERFREKIRGSETATLLLDPETGEFQGVVVPGDIKS